MEESETITAEDSPRNPASRPAAVVRGDVEIDFRRAFRRAFPWLKLVQALRSSFEFGKIALAVVGVLLLELAWLGLDRGLLDVPAAGAGVYPQAVRRNLEKLPLVLPFIPVEPAAPSVSSLTIAEPIYVFLNPLSAFVAENPLSWNGLHAVGRLLAAVVVWGFFGCAIARIALVQAGLGRGLSAKRSLRYVLKHPGPAVLTPLLPMLVVALAALACWAFSLIFRIPAVGRELGGMLLIVPIGFGVLMFAMVAGLAGGWPLMVASAAAEGEDPLDALSRSFSYLNHRLGAYLFYVAAAVVVGIPGLVLINWTVDGVLGMTLWGLRPVTAVEATVPALLGPVSAYVPSSPPVDSSAGSWWVGLVRLIPRAWAYSYFWTSAALVYLLIRKDVDGAEWSQLNLSGDEPPPA